jgi:hypothetical protein
MVTAVRKVQPPFADGAQIFQFFRLDVLALVLCKAIQENGAAPFPVGDDHPITAGATGSRPGNALLDQAAAQICVDRTLCRPLDGLAQTRVGNLLLPGEPPEPLRLENPHHKL